MTKSIINKAAQSLALSSLLIAGQASADTLLGLYLGGDGWRTDVTGSFGNSEPAPTFNFDTKTQGSFFIALEHPVPVLPNIRLAHHQLQADGVSLINAQFSFGGEDFTINTTVMNQVDLTNTDVVLYYEILDNSVIALDLGLTGKHIKGSASVVEQAENGLQGEESVSQWLPMVYVSSKVGLPLTGLDIFAQGNYIGWSDSRMYDVQAGIGYEIVDSLAVDIRFKVGYRAVNLRLDDLDNLYSNLDFKGAFAGVELHF
jgi:outer membrane protein